MGGYLLTIYYNELPFGWNRVSADQPETDTLQSQNGNNTSGGDRSIQATTTRMEVEALVFDSKSDTSFAIEQLCERDLRLMGTYAGYEFTESPYCPTNAIPGDRLVIVEVPHPE